MSVQEAVEPGRIALVRQRHYLVERVTPPPSPEQARLVDLSCLDEDAQGAPLSVLWEHEMNMADNAQCRRATGNALAQALGVNGKVTELLSFNT